MIWTLITQEKFRRMKLRMWDGRCHHQWFSRKKWGLDGGLQHRWDRDEAERRANRLILAAWSPGLGSALQGGQRPIWHFSQPGGHWTKPDLWPDSHTGLNLLTGRSDTWQGRVKGQIQWDFSLVSNQFQQLTASVCLHLVGVKSSEEILLILLIVFDWIQFKALVITLTEVSLDISVVADQRSAVREARHCSGARTVLGSVVKSWWFVVFSFSRAAPIYWNVQKESGHQFEF